VRGHQDRKEKQEGKREKRDDGETRAKHLTFAKTSVRKSGPMIYYGEKRDVSANGERPVLLDRAGGRGENGRQQP